MIIVLVVAAVAVSTPIAAALIVTIASLREESAHTLCSRPPGRLEAVARRVLSFQAYGLADLIKPRIPRPRAPMDQQQDKEQQLSTPRL